MLQAIECFHELVPREVETGELEVSTGDEVCRAPFGHLEQLAERQELAIEVEGQGFVPFIGGEGGEPLQRAGVLRNLLEQRLDDRASVGRTVERDEQIRELDGAPAAVTGRGLCENGDEVVGEAPVDGVRLLEIGDRVVEAAAGFVEPSPLAQEVRVRRMST